MVTCGPKTAPQLPVHGYSVGNRQGLNATTSSDTNRGQVSGVQHSEKSPTRLGGRKLSPSKDEYLWKRHVPDPCLQSPAGLLVRGINGRRQANVRSENQITHDSSPEFNIHSPLRNPSRVHQVVNGREYPISTSRYPNSTPSSGHHPRNSYPRQGRCNILTKIGSRTAIQFHARGRLGPLSTMNP